MKDILFLNISVFFRLILAFISLLIGLQGNYLLAFGVLFIIAILDYYDLFFTKKSFIDTPLKWELNLITRFIGFSLVPIIFSFFYFDLIQYSFLVYIPLILYVIATALNTAFNMQLIEEKRKLPLINISGLTLVLFMAILYSAKNLWFLYLAVVLSLSYLIIQSLNKRAKY